MPKTVVVIPTYNERANVPFVVPQVLAAAPESHVLIVDDESPDGTGELVREMATHEPRLHLTVHRPKMGLGPAYKEGFRVALDMNPEFIVQMDADLSHPPDMVPELIAKAADADLVLGSRYINGITVVNWPMERLLMSYFGNAYARRVTGLPVRDATGGFKCWRAAALRAIDISKVQANGYAFQIETTFRAWKRGLRIVETPIMFVDRTKGDSKMSKRIGLEALWIVWRMRLSSALGRL